jgi:hypothetical protein
MEDNKLGQAEKIVADMEKETKLSRVEELIKDNKITFDYNDKKYRVRLLNLKEKEELDILRRKKFGQLMKDKDIFLEKDLIIQYKERGIDIGELDEQIKKLNAEDLDLQIKLGESISKNEPETILKTYKDQIIDLRIKKQTINTQKNLLLEFSMENSLLNYIAQVITYLSLEEEKDDKWQRMFQTLEEFQTYEDEELINKAGTYSMVLQYI